MQLAKSEERLKFDLQRLIKDQEDLRSKLIDMQRLSAVENEKLRIECHELRAKLIEESRIARIASIEEQGARTDESIRKLLAQAIARAEEADKKLQERNKHYNTLYGQHRDTKTQLSDTQIRLQSMENQMKEHGTASSTANPSGGQMMQQSSNAQQPGESVQLLKEKYDSIKYKYRKLEDHKQQIEKELLEAQATIAKKSNELDAMFQDSEGIYT